MFFSSFIFFLLLLLGVLFGAHYFLFYSLTKFFVLSQQVRYSLAIVLSFLAISFILSSSLAHWKEDILTKNLYLFSGIWLGVLTNLVLFFFLAWITAGIVKSLGININSAALASMFIFLSLFYSFWGVWNALHPKIKNVTVAIPNLPSSWKGKKIVQLSDVHLGMIHGQNFMDQVVSQVNSVKPQMVVITGDLFDGMDGQLDSLVAPLDRINAPQGVFFVTGNHETYLGLDEVFATLQNTSVKHLQDEVIDISGLKLIGIDYPSRGEQKKVTDVLEKLKPDYLNQPNILLYHSPTDIDQIKNQGINLELCGHTHRGQLFPFRYVTSLIYHGYDYGLFPMDNYTLYTTNGVGTWGPLMRTGNTPEIVVITLQ